MPAESHVASPATFEARREAIFERLAGHALDQLDPEHHLMPSRPLTTGLHSQGGGFGIRDSANALVALAMTGREQRAWQVLDSLLDYQDTDPASFTCGNFRWYSTWKRVRDPNAASFMVPKLCYVLRHRGQVMPESLRKRLDDALRLAVDGLNAHRAAWEYTNIWLLNTASKLMIADVLDDPRARDLGYLDWEEWRNWTGRLGAIPEANCPGYTFVHLDAMALMLTCQLDPGCLREVRTMMCHLISSVVLDYHPDIGVVTGPKSRGKILRRGDAALDTILHFVLEAPEPAGGCHLWLGAPIGPDDVLPIAAAPKLPRRTHSHSHGFSRFNHMTPDYTLGGVNGKGGFTPQRIPFFIAHRTAMSRCTVPIEVPAGKEPDACYTDQDQGRMLTACVWKIADQPGDEPALKSAWLSPLTGLNCGRPDNLLRTERPGFEVALGSADEQELFTPRGALTAEQSQAVTLDTDTLVLRCERIVIGLRWFCHGDEPCLTLQQADDGEMHLHVQGQRGGISVGANERAAMLGVVVDIRPVDEVDDPARHAATLAAAPLDMTLNDSGWHVEAVPAHGRPLTVNAKAQSGWLYGVDEQRVSVNEWALSLRSNE